MKKITALLLTFLLAFIAAGFSCKKGGETAEQKLRKNLPIEIPSPLPVVNQFDTPKGALGATNLPFTDTDKQLAGEIIDAGLDRLFESVKNEGFGTGWTTYYPYTVVFAQPTSYSLEGNCPTLNMKNGQKIAGTVISVGNPDAVLEPPFILVAANTNPTPFCRDFLTNAVRYEGEHIILWYNDRSKFYAFTGANDIHPIFPLPSENLPVQKALSGLLANDTVPLGDLDPKTVEEVNQALRQYRGR